VDLTLGVEEELHLVDLETMQLASRGPQLLARLPPDSFSAELQRTTVETNTKVCSSLDELREDIGQLRDRLIATAAEEGLGVAAVGTPPISSADDFRLTATGRFGRMQQEYRLLVDEQLICGTQVHVGLPNREVAVQVTQRVSRDLPLLLALSASSPYWHGADTGYSSIRTIIWQRWPTAGATGPLASAAEYDDLLTDLIASGVIADAKMAYFDVRPSAHAPTVELRVCDACPIVDDAVLIAGLFRGLVAAAQEASTRGDAMRPVPAPMHRAAMWRAARSGLSGDLLNNDAHPQPIAARQAIRDLLTRLRPYLEELGDWDQILELTRATMMRGNSADRQRAAYADSGSMDKVVELVVAETHGTADVLAVRRAGLRSYPARAGDEAFMASGQARPAYRDILEAVEAAGLPDLAKRSEDARDWASSIGMNFGVDGEQRPFPTDLLPRVIMSHEWARLSAGLAQRARAIEAFLQDAYGPARLVDDGVMPRSTLTDSPGWSDDARRLPAGSLHAPIQGFDLVRGDHGDWWVLEDNVRVPSGAGYAIAMRTLMDEVMPDVPRPAGLLDPHSVAPLLREALEACAPPDHGSVIGLLSDGAGNSAWFEHRLLAEQAGLLLLTPDDVKVTDNRVFGLDGTQLDVLYLRLDVDLINLRDSAGEPIGAGIFEAAAAGEIGLANAPGNGLADDKAMYCRVPDLVAYYLRERPLLSSIPTYRCVDETECRAVLERVGELVTKPIDGYGGGGVLIGPFASAAEVSRRRIEIAAHPSMWVAQEVVSLSAHPTFDGEELEPRHVDLRAFVYLTGLGEADARVGDLALTRVAPSGSMVVNSSRGGGAKDTWIIGPPSDLSDPDEPAAVEPHS
jgi:carboxylate-amine ligase